MGEWIKEAANGFGLTLEITEHPVHRDTPFQTIDLYQTSGKGKLLMLNGIIQLTSWDEFCYHEMMAHTVMCACSQEPEKVLVVGGGDGGVLRDSWKSSLNQSSRKVLDSGISMRCPRALV